MQNVNIYIWGDERQNTHHFLDYINNSKTNAISLFFLKHKPAGLTRQKNVYLFDFPDEKNVAWIDIICTIVDKIHATSVRIHSAVHYAQTINFALIKAFRSRTENGLSLTLFLYESSLNDIAWRQEIDKSLSAGLRWQDYAQQFNAKLTRDSGGWHPCIAISSIASLRRIITSSAYTLIKAARSSPRRSFTTPISLTVVLPRPRRFPAC